MSIANWEIAEERYGKAIWPSDAEYDGSTQMRV